MFTLHFILLLGFSTLQIAASENTDAELEILGNNSGGISTSVNTLTSSLNQPLVNELSDDYDDEEFQDNRIRLMLQPKKPFTLNETKLRIWPVNPNNSNNVPIISYRSAFAIQSSEEKEISRNEITENISKVKKMEENSNDYEIVTNSPIINSTVDDNLVTSKNKTDATPRYDSEQGLNEQNLFPKNENAKTDADSKHVHVDLTDVTEEKISNVTVVTGKFVASLPPTKNTSSPIQNETIMNDTTTKQPTSVHASESKNIFNGTTEQNYVQKKEKKPSISTGVHAGNANVQETTHLPSNLTNQTQDLENDNFYEELEPDILSEENDTDYITLNETTVDENNTVLIVLPGGDTKKGDKFTETGALLGKPYISEAISQNLLHLLMNLTAMTAVNERNGKKILRELQDQKGQLQALKKQSNKIYNYITTIKNDEPK